MYYHVYFPSGSVVKNPLANAGDVSSIPGPGRSQRRKWQPTPVLLLGKFHGQKSVVGYSPWGRKRVKHDFAAKHTHTHFIYTLMLAQVWKAVLQTRASQVVLVVKNPPAKTGDYKTRFQSLGWEDPRRRAWQPTPVFLPGGSYGQRSQAIVHRLEKSWT